MHCNTFLQHRLFHDILLTVNVSMCNTAELQLRQQTGISKISYYFLKILTSSLYSFKMDNCWHSRCKNELRISIFNFSLFVDDCIEWHHTQDFNGIIAKWEMSEDMSPAWSNFPQFFPCFNLSWQEGILHKGQSLLHTYTVNSVIKHLFPDLFFLIILYNKIFCILLL